MALCCHCPWPTGALRPGDKHKSIHTGPLHVDFDDIGKLCYTYFVASLSSGILVHRHCHINWTYHVILCRLLYKALAQQAVDSTNTQVPSNHLPAISQASYHLPIRKHTSGMHIDDSSPKKRCFFVEILKSRRWKPTRLGLSALDPIIEGVITDTNAVIMNSAFVNDSELAALERMTQHLVLTLSSVTNINDMHAKEYIQEAARFHTEVLIMSSKVAARQLPVTCKMDNEEPNFPVQRSKPDPALAGLRTEENVQDHNYVSLQYHEAYPEEVNEPENDREEHIPWVCPTKSSVCLTIPAIDLPVGRNTQHPSPRRSPMDPKSQHPSKTQVTPQSLVDPINVFSMHFDMLRAPDPESTMIATTVLPLTEGSPTPTKVDRMLDGGKLEASAEPSYPTNTSIPIKGPFVNPLGSQPEPSAHLSVLDMNSLPTIKLPFNDNATVHYQDRSPSSRQDRSGGYRRRPHASTSTAAVATALTSATPSSNYVSARDCQSSMPSHQVQRSSSAQVPPPTPSPGLTRTRYTSVPSKPPPPTRAGDTDIPIRRASSIRAALPGVPRTDLTSAPRSMHIYTASTPPPIPPFDHHPSEILLFPSGALDNSAATREGGGAKQHQIHLDAEFSGGLGIHHRQRAGACGARSRRSVSLSVRRRRRQSTSSSTSGMHIEIEYYRLKMPVKEAIVGDGHIRAHIILEKVDPRSNSSH